MVAGSTMPVFPLNRDEIQDITIYLMTLLDNRDRARYLPLLAKKAAMEPAPEKTLPTPEEGPAQRASGTLVEFNYDGKRLFTGAGCVLCHTIEASGGEVGPALTYIGRKRSAENLERLLKDPEEILPGGKMPQLYLNSLQIKALVRYLGERR
jgi:mono/diheme cytochrome c family protein